MPVLDSFSLAGRTALITGGSRGIGHGLARALGEAGARVALTATTIEAARSAADDLRAAGLDAHGYELDVTDREQVDDVVAQVGREGGGVDVLVNNAGISIGGAALEIEDDVWHRTLATNLDGVWYCSRAVARQMVEDGRGGTIVNVGSMSAQIVNRPRWQPAYLASKAAVHQLTKGLAAEWAPHGIRVNAIAPGYVLTEASPVDQPEYYDDCVAPAAMKRWGTPGELGPVVVMLASDASSFMTGAVVTVDGGYTLF